MPRNEPTRVYVRTADKQFARLLWAHNNRPNEMLLGAYGLDGHPAIITYEFPERVHTKGEPREIKFRYEEASPVHLKIDHFTCHADGRFHAKAQESDVLYSQVEHFGEALGPASPPFLRVLVVSDRLSRYTRITGEPKKPHVWFQAHPESILAMNFVFSGVHYPLEQGALATMASRGRDAAGIVLVSGTLKGIVWGNPRQISDEAVIARPPGTLLAFSWPRGARRWGFKAFILN
jgi:hypothetical protein